MAIIFSKGDKLEQSHYTVLKELGLGGMGVVYHCRDEQLMRDVAIKMLLPELMADRANVEIFRQEARLAAQLDHPNIVTVYDIGLEERQKKQHHFVCMEYLPGGNLASRLAVERLEVEHCLNWMKQLASGLAFAHKRNVVHQDIKADNIFITTEGDLKIGDFGLARLLVGRVHYDSTVQGMGTPAYMSPELCRGEPQDDRSDIYSLGILFFEMATGHLPFQARGMIEMATKHSSAPIPSARRINSLIPEVLDKVIRRMMGKLPEERYASMSEVLTLLDDLIFEMRVKRMGLSTNRATMRSGPVAPEAVQGAKERAANAGKPASQNARSPEDLNRLQRGMLASQNVVRTQSSPLSETAKTSADLIAQLEETEMRRTQQLAGGVSSTSPAAQAASALASEARSVPPTVTTPAAKSTAPGASIPLPAKSASPASSAQSASQTPIANRTGSTPATTSGASKAPHVPGRGQTISGANRAVSLGWKPSLESQWRFQSMGPIGWSSAPVVDKAETTFFVTSADGTVYAVDINTGKSTWHYSVGAPMLASPVLVGDKLFLADASGKLQSIAIGKSEPVWQHQLAGPIVSTPAIFRDVLFVPTVAGKMIATDIFSGSTRWEFKTEDSIVCSPHRHAELVLFGTRSGAFHAVSAESGRPIWKFPAAAPIVASPAASVDSVYFGTQAGTFFALEADTGGLIWEYPTDKAIVSKAVIAFTSVIFCSHDRWLYCCEKYDGSLKWKASVRGKTVANLVVHKETVLVATQEGWLQAFHTRSGAMIWQTDLSRKLESPPVLAGDHLLQATIEGEVLSFSTAAEGTEKTA